MKRRSLKRWLITGIVLLLINDFVQIAIAVRQYRKKLNRKAHKRIIRGLKKKARRARVIKQAASAIKEN